MPLSKQPHTPQNPLDALYAAQEEACKLREEPPRDLTEKEIQQAIEDGILEVLPPIKKRRKRPNN